MIDAFCLGPEHMPSFEAWGNTDPGNVRKNNEDAWLIDPALSLAVVADGMGGAACGEVASAITAETISEYLRENDDGEKDAPTLIAEAIGLANRRVLDKARVSTDCKGMGSTVVLALLRNPLIYISNVGDSRAYLLRSGVLTQLSYDQTLLNELCSTTPMTPEEIERFPHKHVLTMAVGTTERIKIQNYEGEVEVGDQILLCSDGLTGPVSDTDMKSILEESITIEEKVDKLIALAKERGGPDNVTAVILHCLP
ncbi:MAG: Stp1/IreP family PP2C-type Ser/Thr phosphatase [Bryobacterales bacterium]|nr:Stp1/IreP family PP2C-type Ser/Thr phosphatase [Bryobacterales bacterium]